jgi:hypothetical protein
MRSRTTNLVSGVPGGDNRGFAFGGTHEFGNSVKTGARPPWLHRGLTRPPHWQRRPGWADPGLEGRAWCRVERPPSAFASSDRGRKTENPNPEAPSSQFGSLLALQAFCFPPQSSLVQPDADRTSGFGDKDQSSGLHHGPTPLDCAQPRGSMS